MRSRSVRGFYKCCFLFSSRRRHTRSLCDWSSDVCSSDLAFCVLTDPAAADFLVDYHVAVRTQNATVERVYPGYPGVACGPYGCWSGWGWGPPEVAFQNVRYHEGTFVIDVALREPRKLAYRAISRKELNNKHTITPYQADEAVEHLLKGLKAK